MVDIIIWAMAGVLAVFVLFVLGVGIWAIWDDRRRKERRRETEGR